MANKMCTCKTQHAGDKASGQRSPHPLQLGLLPELVEEAVAARLVKGAAVTPYQAHVLRHRRRAGVRAALQPAGHLAQVHGRLHACSQCRLDGKLNK